MMKVFVYEFYRITLEGCNFGAYIYEYFIELLYLCIWWLINAILSVPGLQFSKRFGKNAMVSERDLGIGKANDKQMRGDGVRSKRRWPFQLPGYQMVGALEGGWADFILTDTC